MKKIFVTLLLLIPALLVSAQGPIRQWNDKLDAFIEVFNQCDPDLEKLYSDNGINAFTFTYYEPETKNVVKEASIFNNDAFKLVDDELMNQAKAIVVNRLSEAAKKDTKLNNILNEFSKKDTNIVLLYSTNLDDNKATKQILITPEEIKAKK